MNTSRTVLLFGEADDNGVPDSVLAHFGNEAYEHYMVAPYARELMMVRNSDYLCWSPFFEHLYAALLALDSKETCFEELGSTLYTTIDKLNKLNALHAVNLSDLNVQYCGIEVSKLLVDLAEALHEGHQLKHYLTWRAVPRPHSHFVSRSYQSTSYAFDETDELFDWITSSRFGIHGVWWCIDGGQARSSMAGNPITLFDPDHFQARAEQTGHELIVLKAERFQYRDMQYAAAWIMVSDLNQHERQRMTEILRHLQMPIATSVCELRASDLAAQPLTGAHAGFSQVCSGRPFDFENEQLASRWRQYVGSG